MPSSELEHVVIAGGGLAGLSAALSFHYLFPRHSLTVPRLTIYERESDENIRVNEGYAIAIRADRDGGGVQALKTISEDLYDDIRRLATAKGETNAALKFCFGVNCDLNPAVKFNKSVEEEESFSIVRYKLRNRLVEEVKHTGESKMTLEWNSHVIKADYDEERNRVNVTLKDGRTDQCDLLIVADGANSSVRRYMYPEARLKFHKQVSLSSVTMVDDNENLPSQIRTSPLAGSTGRGLGLFMAAIDEKSFFWSVTYPSDVRRSPPFKGSAMTQDEQEGFVNKVLTRSNGCLSDEFRSFVRKCDRQRILILNGEDKFPHKNPSEKHIVFIGDSLHAMNPTAGNGANMAIMDGLELVQLLIKHREEGVGDRIARSIEEFDRDHVQRSIVALQISHRNMAFAVATGIKFQLNKLLIRTMAFSVNNPFLLQSLFIGFAGVCALFLTLYVRELF